MQEFKLLSISLLRRITFGKIDTMKTANVLRENGCISKDVILMFDEMFWSKCEEYFSGDVFGADEDGELFKGIVCFMIVGLQSDVPYHAFTTICLVSNERKIYLFFDTSFGEKCPIQPAQSKEVSISIVSFHGVLRWHYRSRRRYFMEIRIRFAKRTKNLEEILKLRQQYHQRWQTFTILRFIRG